MSDPDPLLSDPKRWPEIKRIAVAAHPDDDDRWEPPLKDAANAVLARLSRRHRNGR